MPERLARPVSPLRAAYRQAAIDLIRGLTALVVAIDHFMKRLNGSGFPRAHLAVELFFVMSGFVLTRRLTAQHRARLPLARFMLHRLSRLYPIYAVGLAIGVLEYVVVRAGGISGWVTPISAADVAANFLLLPAFWSTGLLFPINGPMWTLPIEIGLNTVLFPLIEMSRPYLVLLIVLAAATVTIAGYHAGSLNLGWSSDTLTGGWARGTFAFLAGIFLARAKRLRLESGWWIVPVLLGFALLTICPGPARWALPLELAGAIVAVPALFFLASGVQLTARAASGARRLATLSFPLYCLHMAIVRPVIDVGHILRLSDHMMTAIYLLLCIGVAMLVGNMPVLAARAGNRRTRTLMPT